MSALARARLYADAVRRMRPRQLAHRPRRALPPRLLAAGLRAPAALALRPLAAGLGADPAPQSGPSEPPHVTGAFAFVGASRQWDAERFWCDGRDGLLFLFCLHGFDALATYAAGPHDPAGDAFWAAVVEDWLDHHVEAALPAWHPYPTSQRLIAWAAALSAIGGWREELRARAATSAWHQAALLRRSIEHDIGGNHVLTNGVGLCFAGAVLEGSPFLDVGLGLLERELPRQLLADGGHEERSTSYHRQIAHRMRDVAALLERSGRAHPPWLARGLDATAAWQRALTGPDGTLPLLNDAWEGPPAGAAERAPEGIAWLADSGYAVFRTGGDQAVFDAGIVAPPHLPPHAHADVLSFVLWGDGRALVVDPGAFSYNGPWRDRLRGTAAHNTVLVDERDQCLLWGDFRVAFPPAVRAQPPLRRGDATLMAAAHDGYRRLADPVEHQRVLVWLPGDGLVVVDRLRCDSRHEVRSALHLAPGVRPGAVGPFAVRGIGEQLAVRERAGVYAPYLGRMEEIAVLEQHGSVAPRAPFGWSLLRAGAEVVALDAERLTVRRAAGEATIGLAWP